MRWPASQVEPAAPGDAIGEAGEADGPRGAERGEVGGCRCTVTREDGGGDHSGPQGALSAGPRGASGESGRGVREGAGASQCHPTAS